MDERLRRTLDAYERAAADYEERNADRSVVADLVERFIDAVDGPRVLDVGCGPGWETATFARAGHDAVGFDLTPSFLARTRERPPGPPVVRGDMRSLPFADDAFDGLWACASPLHVPKSEFRPTLREFRRVLQPDGVCCLSMQRPTEVENEGEGTGDQSPPSGGGDSPSSDESEWQGTAEDGRHFAFYSVEALAHHLAAADFRVTWRSTGDEWVQLLARPADGE